MGGPGTLAGVDRGVQPLFGDGPVVSSPGGPRHIGGFIPGKPKTVVLNKVEELGGLSQTTDLDVSHFLI